MAVKKRNGNWWVDTYVNGERLRRKIGPDKRTAELAEKNLKIKAAQGEWLDIHTAKRISFKAFCKEFISRQTGKAPGTIRSYTLAIDNHLVPYFGDRHLSEIRPRHVDEFLAEKANGLKLATARLLLQHLKHILNAAVRWNYLKESPARTVKTPNSPEREPRYFNRDELAAALNATSGRIQTLVILGANTGLRISEMLALRWEDIDFRRGLIKVRCDEDFTTKGKRNREVPMNGTVLDALQRHPRHLHSSLVFHSRTGESVPRDCIYRSFKKTLRDIGLGDYTVHTLRHTFGTQLAANGVDVRTIQELMGHTNIATTMKYLHAAPSRMQKAVENLHLDGTSEEVYERHFRPDSVRNGQDLVTGVAAQQQGQA
jgi:integrase